MYVISTLLVMGASFNDGYSNPTALGFTPAQISEKYRDLAALGITLDQIRQALAEHPDAVEDPDRLANLILDGAGSSLTDGSSYAVASWEDTAPRACDDQRQRGAPSGSFGYSAPRACDDQHQRSTTSGLFGYSAPSAYGDLRAGYSSSNFPAPVGAVPYGAPRTASDLVSRPVAAAAQVAPRAAAPTTRTVPEHNQPTTYPASRVVAPASPISGPVAASRQAVTESSAQTLTQQSFEELTQRYQALLAQKANLEKQLQQSSALHNQYMKECRSDKEEPKRKIRELECTIDKLTQEKADCERELAFEESREIFYKPRLEAAERELRAAVVKREATREKAAAKYKEYIKDISNRRLESAYQQAKKDQDSALSDYQSTQKNYDYYKREFEEQVREKEKKISELRDKINKINRELESNQRSIESARSLLSQIERDEKKEQEGFTVSISKISNEEDAVKRSICVLVTLIKQKQDEQVRIEAEKVRIEAEKVAEHKRLEAEKRAEQERIAKEKKDREDKAQRMKLAIDAMVREERSIRQAFEDTTNQTLNDLYCDIFGRMLIVPSALDADFLAYFLSSNSGAANILSRMVAENRHDTLNVILQKLGKTRGCESLAVHRFNSGEKNNITLLHYACMQPVISKDIVLQLADRASVHAEDADGKYPIEYLLERPLGEVDQEVINALLGLMGRTSGGQPGSDTPPPPAYNYNYVYNPAAARAAEARRQEEDKRRDEERRQELQRDLDSQRQHLELAKERFRMIMFERAKAELGDCARNQQPASAVWQRYQRFVQGTPQERALQDQIASILDLRSKREQEARAEQRRIAAQQQQYYTAQQRYNYR